ncbi:MAG: DUF4435 domain-containing protein [Bacteroidaceae bacterium]|nr:DUF4435 domain-containing protein [Bacteroidaceae bacterium]
MTGKLRDSLTSSYIDAANKLYPKNARKRILAYVESYDDVAFWRDLLSEFEDDKHYFQVMLPSSDSLSKGKKMVLMNTLNTDQLGKSLIACVDSDYDFLLQGVTNTSDKINSNKYIFQTYAYAIENYHCYAEALHEVCVQATLNDRVIIDFVDFMKQYSRIAYPLFLWNIWFYRQRDTNTFPMHVFNHCTELHFVDLRKTQKSLASVEKRVSEKLSEMRLHYPDLIPEVEHLGEDLKKLGVEPDTTYLYMQGHHIMDNVVMKLLEPVCVTLRREREDEIRRLAEHEAQYKNEYTCYENSQTNVAAVLKRNIAYKSLYQYQWVREDLRDYMAKG